jgi:ABC-type uncharacterized transport system substrate-binding protein
LQLLKQAVPNLSRVAVLLDPIPGARQQLREMEIAAPALGLQLQAVEVRSPGEFDGAFATATRAIGLIVPPSLVQRADQVVA